MVAHERNHSHYVKREFLRWLDDFSAVTDSDALLHELSFCSDPLPRDYCTSLSLPEGSTYRDAVALMDARWTLKDEF